jgi:transposase
MIRKKKDSRLLNLETKVKSNLNKLCDFDKNINLVKVNTNSCFDFNKGSLSTYDNFIPLIDNSNDDIPKYKSKIVNMSINQNQFDILHKWFNSYIDMYNEVINFFNKNYIYDHVRNLKIIYNENKTLYIDMKNSQNEIKLLLKQKKKLNLDYDKLIKNGKKKNKSLVLNKNKNKVKNKTKNEEIFKQNKQKINDILKEIKDIKVKIINLNITTDKKTKIYNQSLGIKNKEYNKLMNKLNYKNVRTYHLKNIRDHIQSKSSNNNKLRIRIHILDCAIKLACTSYKSCVSNYLNGNIKKFKIRYWRHNKKNKIMEIEKEFIRNNELLFDVFGSFNLTYNNKKYKLTGNETVSILYCSNIKKYYMLVAEKIELKETKYKKYIAIDQGIKPFVGCRTNNELINIGTNIAGLVGNHIKQIDTINNNNKMNKKQKRKKERKIYLKMKNQIDEVHWKTIKYITNNYGNVIIGNLSMKKTTKKEKSKLSPELKRIGLMMRFSEFRNRLRYKCLINRIKIEIIDEAYTSKVCSTCGNCKHELNGEKDYECEICNVTRDRDFNSATNMILLKM